jgi:hypothetical protein
MAQARRARFIILSALVLGASVTLSFVWTVLLAWRSGKVILQDCDPSYCLRVAEGSKSYSLVASEQRYEIWITRRATPDHGYIVDHSFAFNDFDSNVTIRASKVEWSPDGVTLIEPTGQRLFVPERLYEGSR